MAMNKEMRALCLGQVAAEGQELLNIQTFRRDATRLGLDYVVKTQLEPPMRVEGAEGLGLGPARIEKREHVSDARLAIEAELIDPANCHLKRRQAL